MPAPALRTRVDAACHAMPSRGAKLSLVACHNGVPWAATVMVLRFATPFTVYGRVPLGEEGAALYSHRSPYVTVSFRDNFQVSCANRLQFAKTILISDSVDWMAT